MVEALKTSDLPALIAFMNTWMDKKRAALAELDSLTGDGDMGVTIALIFRSAVRCIKYIDEDASFAEIFANLAETIGENAPSTFGTLMSTMLQSMADNADGVDAIDAEEFSRLLHCGADGVSRRGGAKEGDKTLLDAQLPAARAAAAGMSFSAAAAAAAAAAQTGADLTVNMKAVTGRAGYMGDRTVGSRDPGAQAIADILASIDAWANE